MSQVFGNAKCIEQLILGEQVKMCIWNMTMTKAARDKNNQINFTFKPFRPIHAIWPKKLKKGQN